MAHAFAHADGLDMMPNVEIEGWRVHYSAPTLAITDHLGRVVFLTEEWSPNFEDPRADALMWASAVASEDSGLTVDYDDDPRFGKQVRYVREHAPACFADSCVLESGEYDD